MLVRSEIIWFKVLWIVEVINFKVNYKIFRLNSNESIRLKYVGYRKVRI